MEGRVMDEPTELPITWRQMVPIFPQFVQWIAQTVGPLPEGNVQKEDYERFKALYEEAHA